MSLFDRLIAAALPLVPRPIVRAVARRYIAGETLADAVRTVRTLNAEGALATLDVLGEDTREATQAAATVDEYVRALDAIVAAGLQCNVSVKLTALGLLFDRDVARDHLRTIVERAGRDGRLVRIDMEDSGVTQATLDVYRELRSEFENVGPVLQAYLRRSLDDVRALLEEVRDPPLNVRLCKGIYAEPASVAWQDRETVRRSFCALLERLLRGGAYVGIATHDEPLVFEGVRLVRELGLERDAYEFQMLHGVLPEMRRQLVADGHRVRVYVPYGVNWHGYSVRRLRENPKIAGYVLKAMFLRGV